jgi:methylenetetrahydrofolate dehydrogenase (NADP+)/methenyltetrahydrofolate cyclohydrolase
MTKILRGKPVVEVIKSELLEKIINFKKKDIFPKLGIIRVGARPDDVYYESGIKKFCDFIELSYEIFEYHQDISEDILEKIIINLGNRKDINGILMFVPLPKHINEQKIRSLIPVTKDIDCMNVMSAGQVYADIQTAFPPCTPAACMELMRFYDISLQGKRCVIVGRSLVVGKPLAILLLREHATVTICHSKTINLVNLCKEADILIVAIGRAKMINAEFVRSGQIVLDVGINLDSENQGQYCGDVDFVSVEPIVASITPVPGGIGSITTAILCKHTVQACEMQFCHGAQM